MMEKVPIREGPCDLLNIIFLGGLAFALRFPEISVKHLEIDEAFQLFTIAQPSLRALFQTLLDSGPQQYPLDYIIGFIPAKFTHDIHLLRIPSLMWGIGSVITAYVLGRDIYNRAFGWVWGFLLSISVLHIQYSQTLRPYSLMVFLSLVSSFFFFQALNQRKRVWLYGLTAFLYQLVYPLAIGKSFLELVFVQYSKNKQRTSFSLIILASWLIPFVHFLFMGKEIMDQNLFMWETSEAFGFGVISRIVLEISQYSSKVSFVFTGLLFLGLARGLISRTLRFKTIFAIGLLLVPVISLTVSLSTSGLFLRSRHLLPLLPIVLGLIAIFPVHVAIKLETGIPGQFKRLSVGFYLVLAVLFFALTRTSLAAHRRELANIRHLIDTRVQALKNHISQQDKIVLNNPNSGATFVYYYDPSAFFRLEGIKLFRGFALFQFPELFNLSKGEFSNQTFTFFRPDNSIATMDRDRFSEMETAMKKGEGKIWLIDLPLNYFQVLNPFEGIVPTNYRLIKIEHGLFTLVMNPP